MNNAWLGLVVAMLLGASLLVVIDLNEEVDDTSTPTEETLVCIVGTVKVENTSVAGGYECVPLDPHSLVHSHPAPELFILDVVDDRSTVTLVGTVNHLHPDELNVTIQHEGLALATTHPSLEGNWSVSFSLPDEGPADLEVLARHALENTSSPTVTVQLNRTQTEDDAGQETGNGNDDQTTNETEGDNGGSNSTNDNAGNETNNGSDDSPPPIQPTYDASDLGQFWLDVFRCQAGHNVTQVDDLTTSTVETHECSVSITMNETHITIVANGLPDHDFESTLACSEANDCTRAQNYEWTVPRSPVNDTAGGHDDTNCPEANGDYECAAALGEVAIAINGVPFYGPEDGPGGDAVASQHGAYVEDRQAIELGVCHGHSGREGTFHYHADANCLHWHPEEGEDIRDYNISTPAAVANNTANGSHSSVIGVAMDGYPIYGLWGYDDQMNIVEMTSSYRLKDGENGYNGIDDYEYVEGLGHLDVCNGHFGPTPEFPDGIYHYHSTMLNGNGDIGFPYFLLCYHGETYLHDGGNGAGGDDPCAGHGETWGPGIGPPPEGCDPGPPPGGQSMSVSVLPSLVTPQVSAMGAMLSALLWLHQRRGVHSKSSKDV